MELSGKKALVTGASKGLGQAIARALSAAGAEVLLVSRDERALRKVAAEITEAGGRAAIFAGDVSLPHIPGEAVEECVKALGGIDILVNNAGVADVAESATMPPADWARVLQINLTAPFYFSQAAARHMMAQKSGKIIQMASMFGLHGEPGLAAYCASKGGLIQLTRTLAIEWAKYNIQVNAIAPGYFGTEMTAAGAADPAIAQAMLRRIPARRFGRPEELGPLAVYLASKASDFMTGEVLVVDGGQSAR
jgi:2-dehydro-3-deoxy-D-gluconate 5-dehydrogenase